MRRVVFLLLVLCGCARDEALQVTLQLAPALQASCVVLDVLSPDGSVRQSEFLPRPRSRATLVWAVYRRDLPEDVQLQARAFWGSGCEEPRRYNGRSELLSVHFEPDVRSVQLTLAPPGADEDADRDGFVSAEKGGADCDDRQSQRRPGVQELCDASDDLNCDGRRGCDDASCSARLCSQAPTSLVFVPAELSTRAGQCTPVTVERRDASGSAARMGYATPIVLESTLSTGVTLHPDPGCAMPLRATVIPANSSGVILYVRSTVLGSNTLRVTSDAFPPASAAHTLLPGPATNFTFTSPNLTSRAGECSLLSLAWYDAFGFPSPGSLTAFLSTPPRDQPEEGLFLDAQCTQRLVPTQLAAAPTLSFYFRGTRAVTSTFTARSAASVSSMQEIRWVKALEASKLTLSSANGQTLLAGQCSAPVTVRVVDRYDNLSPLPAGQSLTFSTPLEVYAGPGCVSSRRLPEVFYPQGAAEIPLSFKTKTGGLTDLQVSGPSGLGVTQPQVIIPTVRRGSCQLANGEKEKRCSIGPAGVVTSRAFVVFQATSENDTPRSSFVRCGLTSSAVECRRNDSVGAIAIDWQVVELLQGLSVQHLDVPCNQSPYTLNTAVTESSSFVLFSSSQPGISVDRNDFPSVQLTGPRQLQAVTSAGCSDGQTFSLQVVQFTGSQVLRGTTGALSGKSYTVSSLPAADLSRSLVLATWQVGTDDSDPIRKRLLRGAINPADPTQLVFSRGAGAEFDTTDILQISWERITFPAGTLVQTQTLTVNDGETRPVATAPLNMVVDPTRTLLLTSSQVSGQGAGETTFDTNDVLGVATGRVALIPYNQLSVTRDSTRGTSRWTAYAIQFEP